LEPGTLLLLIRHGETQWNVDQRAQGHIDVGLSERGLEQARRLRAALAEEPLDAVYSSDLQRASVTAEVMAAGRVSVITDARLREAHFGKFEGLTATEIEATYPEEFRAWRADSIRNRPIGGETIEELQARCMEALLEILPRHPGQCVAVVAHGGPIRAMVCGLVDLPLTFYPKIRVENTGIARVLFTDRGAILAGLNDICHLRSSETHPAHSGWEEK
jgi:broad specificity phosphatase PhoE